MIFKAFATILKDNPTVHKSMTEHKYIKKKDVLRLNIPQQFSPFEQWANYLSPVLDQGDCGYCYSCSSVGSLMDRVRLFTLGTNRPVLSAVMPMSCDGLIGPKIQLNSLELQQVANNSIPGCDGDSLIDIFKFLYCYGTVSRDCLENKLEIEAGSQNIPICKKLIGQDLDFCENINKPAIFYRVKYIYHIGNDPDDIKREIYHFGPVSTGFMVYTKFLTEYDGKSIYMGPEKGEENEGGHAVMICGWGTENNTDYWWIKNSWGEKFGIRGYFKMKIGIPECKLEENVMCLIPDIPGFDQAYLDYVLEDSKEKEWTDLKSKRLWFNVDSETGYKFDLLKKYRDKQVKINPLFDVKLLPDYKTFVAGEVDPNLPLIRPLFYSYEDTASNGTITSNNHDGMNITVIILIITLLLLTSLLSVKILLKQNSP